MDDPDTQTTPDPSAAGDAVTSDTAPTIDAPSAPPAPSLAISVEAIARINYALQQNGIPVVRRIALENTGDAAISDVLVRCTIAGLTDLWIARIARIDPGDTYNLTDVRLALSPSRLAAQLEREVAELVIEAETDAVPLARTTTTIEILAFNEWAGASIIPEMLAAFITPNHPALQELLRTASDILLRSSGDGALNGYQSRSPQRAAAIAEAIYLAAAARGIGYINPPASFETGGQKIRSVEQILGTRLATCLDLALLLAAAWEQAGLHALVVMLDGHALPAFWTREECFPEPTVEDGLRLRKRLELGEIIPVESTLLTAAPHAMFAAAVKHASDRLKTDAGFICAIDIHAARRQKIRPLLLRSDEDAKVATNEASASGFADVATETLGELLPGLAGATDDDEKDSPESPRTRIDRWKRKLLDLSLRNRLLNFRETRLSIPLLAPDVASLENALAGGDPFAILPRPQLRRIEAVPDTQQAEHAERDALASLLREELADRRLRTTLGEAEVLRRMTELFRATRTSIEESGSSTLYLALGMLTWYETGESEPPRQAPLILLPLQIERRSAREGYRIRQSDEAPRTNITLLEKLRVDFGMDTRKLEDLPEDAAGLDIPVILRRFREAVKDIPRWHITETAWIGLFSFSKFLMWADLQQRTDDLLKSKVVRYLVEPQTEPFDAEAFPDPRQLDRTHPSSELLCPMDADSSQLVAVHAAAGGRSFVLEGPPGTGKSQTITNLIAHALGQGKRVLFVAEKVAALDVVHRRLERCGLAPFCLELHSSKASKKEVIAQIVSAFTARTPEPRNWESQCTQLDARKAELNAYVDELHKIRPSGESFYQAAARLTTLGSAPEVPLRIKDPAAATEDQLRSIRSAVEGLTTAAEAVDNIAQHPLRGIGREQWSESLHDQVRQLVSIGEASARELLDAAESFIAEVTAAPDLDPRDTAASLSAAGLRWLADIAALIVTSPSPREELLTEPRWSELKASLESWIERGRARDALRAQLMATYDEGLLALDLPQLLGQLRTGMAKPVILRWLACRAPRRALAAITRAGTPPPNEQLVADLQRAIELNKQNAALADPANEPARFFSARWNAGEADWNTLQKILDWTDRFRTSLQQCPLARPQPSSAITAGLTRLASSAADQLPQGSPAAATIARFVESASRHTQDRKNLDDLLSIEPTPAWGGDDAPDYLPAFLGALARWTAALPDLNNWCFWRRGRKEGLAAGLEGLITPLEAGTLAPHQFAPAFDRAFTQQWVRATSDANETLRNFSGDAHSAAIEKFRALDNKVIELTRDLLRARLSAGIPAPSSAAAATSEVGLLQRQAALKRGHLPVRRLVEKLPNLLPRLKPCFLMSPLSVAQHLDTSFPPFDVVVFDEASQIPVWDAIGAIARGTEVIVVGDSRQLPPTTFFNRIEGEEVLEEDEIEELESILDECNASGIPSLRLLWHYRSRHESLIAFSNFHYYDNRLNTFPASVQRSESLGVSLRYLPEGRYDRGNTRTNRLEAEAIVEEIIARLRNESGGDTRGSIGVVTFNAAQQMLIEDLLDEKRRELPEIERFFTEGDEPVFVKNLENVQGDERETILFSICYGPDETGRITMNFGPLGHQGGERRLNVAITRARCQVIVFSSIRAEHIDLSRTRAMGSSHLRAFLDYAERGTAAMAEATSLDDRAALDSPFQHAVAKALTARGWIVDRNIGCSGYRIDLAIRKPAAADAAGAADSGIEYLLGIEFDGEFYRSGETARDRDRLRQQVLESLGWQLHRIWSMDWRLNPDRVIERLESALQRAQRTRRTAPTRSSPPAAPSASTSVNPDNTTMPAEVFTAAPTLPPNTTPYQPYTTDTPAGTPEEFYDSASTRRIAATLRKIVEQESPILLSLAARRLAALYGIDRITSRVDARLAEILAADTTRSRPHQEGDVLWSAAHDPATYRAFRTPGETGDTERAIDEIPLPELAAAAGAVLDQQISLPFTDLIREAARFLGFHRTTTRIQAAFAPVKDLLIQRGAEVDPDDTISAGRNWRSFARPRQPSAEAPSP